MIDTILQRQILDIINQKSDFEYINFSQKSSDWPNNTVLLQALSRINSLSSEQLDYLLRYSDLKEINGINYNALMCLFVYQPEITITTEQIDYLIDNNDLNNIGIAGKNSLMIALSGRHPAGFSKPYYYNLNYEQFCRLLINTDLSYVDQYKRNALMLAYGGCYDFASLSFGEHIKDYLLKNCDLKQQDRNGCNALMIAIGANVSHAPLELSSAHWDYLIEHSDLFQKSTSGNDILSTEHGIQSLRPEISFKIVSAMFTKDPTYFNEAYFKDNGERDYLLSLLDVIKSAKDIGEQVSSGATHNKNKL